MFTPNGVSVSGIIEGDGQEPIYRGDTIDYFTFEVTSLGSVRLIGTDLHHSLFLAMGQINPGEEFDIVPSPYLLFPSPTPTPPEFTHVLDPGIYLVQVQTQNEDQGLNPSFIPVNRNGGGFLASPYSFALEGPITPLDFMEGNLDGTFTVTHIPEPFTFALLCTGVAAAFTGRSRRCG